MNYTIKILQDAIDDLDRDLNKFNRPFREYNDIVQKHIQEKLLKKSYLKESIQILSIRTKIENRLESIRILINKLRRETRGDFYTSPKSRKINQLIDERKTLKKLLK